MSAGRNILIQDLEFVQMLSNMDYVIWLAHQDYFGDQTFNNYLKYLRYMHRPEYAHLLLFPQSLDILTLLTSPEVRQMLIDDPEATRHILAEQSLCSWASSIESS